ncbi:MAG: CPBP family intramembrane metalloprotease [Rhodobacteraceae bacterium]|nr:MAG: CPBP family intramembrane metalloprotease [Paracoccaceae bacterium]
MMRRPRAYAAHEILVGPARARPDLWRTLLGFILIVFLTFMLGGFADAALSTLAPGRWSQMQDPRLVGTTPFTMLMLLFGFLFLTVGVAAAVTLLHARGLASVLGPWRAVIRDFLGVAKWLAILLGAIWVLPPWDLGAPMVPNLAPGLWLLLLPLSLAGVLIQTSAEEIVFRGYLQQQLAARFASPLIWVGLPSALFAVGHYLPAEAGGNAIYIALWAGLFGVLMADLTARAGNLGPAIAVHFANNLSSLLLVSLPEGLNGLSLYVLEVDIADREALWTFLPIDFATMILFWLAARVAIRR